MERWTAASIKMECYAAVKMFSWYRNIPLSQHYVQWDTELYAQYDLNYVKMFPLSK